MKKEVFIQVISVLLIILFMYAAVSKLIDVQKFEIQIAKSPLLAKVAPFIAWFIPILEIIVAITLATSRFRIIGLYASFSLMVVFTAYIIAILTISNNIPCSCGGVLEKLGWTEHLIFNVIFVLLSLLGIYFEIRQGSHEHTASPL